MTEKEIEKALLENQIRSDARLLKNSNPTIEQIENDIVNDIVNAIALDIGGRSGIGDAWYNSVPEEKEEIMKSWSTAIKKILYEM